MADSRQREGKPDCLLDFDQCRNEHEAAFSRASREGHRKVHTPIAGLPRATKAPTIFVVDDDRALLRAMARLLDNLGYKSVTAENATDALKIAESGTEIDLVLADLSMAPMNGVELAQAIQLVRPGLPVVILTGSDYTDELREFGADRVLHKPFTVRDLEDKIAAAMRSATSDPAWSSTEGR